MNETNNMRVVTLKDLWDLLVQRIVVIVLAAVIAAGGFLAYDMLTFVPMYSSTATLYILRQSDDVSSSYEASNELNLAMRLVYECNYVLKSRTVLNAVIDELDLDLTYGQLYSHISTSNPTNTRILEITAEAETPELAKAIVDKICDIGPEHVKEAMVYSELNLFEQGTLAKSPSNTTSVMLYAAVGLAAAVLTYAVYLLRFLLDDRIRTEDDIDRYLGLSILAEIPNLNGTVKSRYGYYKGYGKRGYGYGYGYGYGQSKKSGSGQKKQTKETPAAKGSTEKGS